MDILSKQHKINKFHFEEIVLILLILSTDLKKYDDYDLMSFAENIEGRIDELFTIESLEKRNFFLNCTKKDVQDFERLKDLVVNLYSSQWSKKLKSENDDIIKIRILSKQILENLNIDYVEPNNFIENHLEVDW